METHPQSIQTRTDTTIASSKHRHIVETILWSLGLVILAVASDLVHFHPGPWPFDLQAAHFVQQLPFPSWLVAIIRFFSIYNNPLFEIIAAVLAVIALALFRKFQQAIFIALGTGIANTLDGLLTLVVGRPRPSSQLIHVYLPEPFRSFPSGHVEYCVVFYGFLLYLSFTKPAREWRYRWLLIPVQIYAILNILIVGYSRVEAGAHWLTDVLAGYLSGALMLTALIFLYLWTTNALARRRARKQQQQAVTPFNRVS